MELKEIKELIKLVSETGVSEVEIERGDFKIAIKKIEEKVFVQNTATVMQPQMMMAAPASTASPAIPVAEHTSNLITIKSPMIGTFYKSSTPDKPAFIGIGDEIKPGKVLCIIEAMKLFNEIESEISGRIVKVLVENASPVEYDQPLFLVEPM
jgi:acetyl-CoA carboxylase biotin carboxyl carrier protein